MNRRVRNCLAAVFAAALLVSCSGDGDDDADEPTAASAPTVSLDKDAQPYADAIAEASRTGQFGLDEEQSECFGDQVVDQVGVTKLKSGGKPAQVGQEFDDYELVSLGLTQDEGGAVYDSLGTCGYDMRANLLGELLAGEKDEQTRACIEDAVAEERLREFVVTMMNSGQQAAESSRPWQDLEVALSACEPTPEPAATPTS